MGNSEARLIRFLAARKVLLCALVAVLALLPSFLAPFPLRVLVTLLLYVFLAQSWNISGGFAGQFSFLHPVFFGVGAYSSALLFNEAGINPWLAMVAGAILAVAIGLLITYIQIRAKVRHVSAGLVSMAFVFIALYVADSVPVLGGGDRGVQLHRADGLINYQFSSNIGFYYVILAMTVVLTLYCWRMTHTRLGLYFRAIAVNEPSSEAVGLDVTKYSLTAIAISAFFTALAGSFFAQYVGSIFPSTVLSMDLFIGAILFLAIGGMGNLWGPVVGVALVVPIGEILRISLVQFPMLNKVLYGVVVIIILSFAPRGLLNRRKGSLQH